MQRTLNTGESPDIDGITNIMLNNLTSVLSEPLVTLLSRSFSGVPLPSKWEEALVKPLLKSGQRNSFQNYRSISNASIFCGIMEKILVTLRLHYEENGLWSETQHA